jgi:membrane protein
VKFASFRAPDDWMAVLKRTGQEISNDGCFGLAAQLAFYFLLALFPALLFLVALISLLPVEQVTDEWLRAIQPFTPPNVVELIRTQLEELVSGDHKGLLTVGLAGALWSSSAAMAAIIQTLNRAYDVRESRRWWKARTLAVVLTVAFAVFVVLASVLLLTGSAALAGAGRLVGWSDAAILVWQIVRWPLIVALMIVGIDLVYHFAPNVKREWVWVTPGSVVATGLWLAASLGFKFYAGRFADFNETYGTIGGAVMLLLWFYLSGLAILIGAELNAEIERDVTASAKRPEDRLAARAGTPA